jgi:hypothetical protein
VKARTPSEHDLGRERVTVARYVWKWPAAQFGVQSLRFAIPFATARVAFHDDQARFVK